jgi:hypothetical protein
MLCAPNDKRGGDANRALNVPADQLRGQPDVAPIAADDPSELVFFDKHDDSTQPGVKKDLINLGRRHGERN